MLVSAGDDYASPLSLYRTPLGEVLPAVPSGRVVEEPFKPKLTDNGQAPSGDARPGRRRRPRPAPWGRWFRVIDVDPRDAEVLMKGAEGKPLLVLAAARVAWRCSCPIMFGSGRAAMRAAAPRPTFCAGWRTGR